ncbi:MAG: hypothetical protein KKC46_06340 [Proteobacteria bacterium]|nr:hypothetical protein [Pseudomonadota bacterium]
MKKACLILLALVFTCSCATKPVTQMDEPPPLPELSIMPVKKDIKPLFGNLLKEVTISKTSFNPSQKEEIALSFSLSKPARVTVHVYDPDSDLINTIEENKEMQPGVNTVIWNGTDIAGNIVPDEAYFFTITAKDESGKEEIYDPTTFSGGEEHDITTAHIDPQQYNINYSMPEMGRVMIRMGIQGGPLMNQLVDWKPRVKGAITEYWNGQDKDNLLDIYNNPKFKMIVTYFSLPDNSVIAYGNKKIDFLEYKNNVVEKRLQKPVRPTSVLRRSHHYNILRTIDYCPEIKVEFANVKGTEGNGIPVIQGKTMVKVMLDEKDKIIFQNFQFEICFFLDHKFYAEDETGYTPFNWVWDLSNVEEGEHLLTVNISSFKDQIGMISKKVKVVK